MYHKIASLLSIPLGEGIKIINFFHYNQINMDYQKSKPIVQKMKLYSLKKRQTFLIRLAKEIHIFVEKIQYNVI